MIKVLSMLALAAAMAISSQAQVAAGGSYTVEQSVIAGGGGSGSTDSGNIYRLDGVVGQSTAGPAVSGGGISLTSGFFNPTALAPTAADVIVSGRVETVDGAGLVNATVTLTGLDGVARTVITSGFGYFSFEDVPAGATYILEVKSKRFTFAPTIIAVADSVFDLVLTPIPPPLSSISATSGSPNTNTRPTATRTAL
jgi:Carboxypeptidase regulatory-like domain